MRALRYQVATSLDGYIAGKHGEFDWIVQDADIDFKALFDQFDTAIMGRKTFVATLQQNESGAIPGLDIVVFSGTLSQDDYPTVHIENGDPVESIRSLKARPGKDIWLFGGGQLFRTLLDAGLVDTVELAVVPVLLGDGIPMLSPGLRATLSFRKHRLYPKSGIMTLEYAVGSVGDKDS